MRTLRRIFSRVAPFTILGICLVFISCRSTASEIKREPRAQSAASAEAFVNERDIHQNRLNQLLNGKTVAALHIIEDSRQATLYFEKQTTLIRPVSIGSETGILRCRFQDSYCGVISTKEEFKELFDTPIRSLLTQTLGTGSAKNAFEIGRALQKADKDFMLAMPLENVPNKKNAAAFYLALLEDNKTSENGAEVANRFMSLAREAYPELEFGQNIDGMDRDAVNAATVKLSRIKTQDDFVLTKYAVLLKQAMRDRLAAITTAEREEREAERAKAAEEAKSNRMIRNYCAEYCLKCRYSARYCNYVSSETCKCW